MSRSGKRKKPKNGPPWWPCEETGKRGYRSKPDALTVATRDARHFGHQAAYRCPFCGRFHLTTRSRKWGGA